MYPLLHQRYQPGSFEEAFRLGILAFLCPLFLQWDRFELLDARFISSYKESLQPLFIKHTLQPLMMVWLLMIGAISMSHEPRSLAWIGPLLRMNVEACEVYRWGDMKTLLGSILWIDSLYDDVGERIFHSLVTQGRNHIYE